MRRRRPRYLQIADTLRARIRVSPGGARLPSEHALRARFRVSRMTVRQALEVLRQEGLLSRQVGRGTFASPGAAPPSRRLRVIGSVEDMLALGDETWFKPMEQGVTRAPTAVVRALHLEPGAAVARFVGVRHGDDGPFQHVTAYVPERLGSRIADEDLSRTSVIATLERRLGVAVTYLEQAVEVVRCPGSVADLLSIRAGAPILRFHRTYVTADGAAVEHAVTYHWTGRYPYTMMLYRAEPGR